ncbi:FAD-dependent oxidoreductase [Bradyrhizobium sp. INPA01-394B]|uniref:FAD-dependent oxidoreductase n=1 Tax=Bradyrhizobium campsiandrae TaxID=1729892 RepID=A0ABR7UK44_9BRAD|nr:FAD-dependent oxidoreductase [Bradyrhizobium campsiandrae]MBC9883179.1 FAD-dependent oxidoreductase [Bradyrhizobium campsiandrae]MBC9984461.1 FAD-dependent oxidoreductase [Bradyrhizobium campsiandrae]
MRKCEVAVLGLGLMGGAALSALLDAGVDALGFDPVAAGSDRGSSHGSCRIFRRFNFENPNYTSLSDEAHADWIRLQSESGQTVLTETPILEAGRPGSAMVASSRAAAIAKGRADPMVTAPVANKEFPAFSLPDDWDVVVQDGGAILHTATVMRLMRARAGARVIPERASFMPHHDGVSIRTDSEEFFAERAILALGPWLGRALPPLAALLNVTRQPVGWFAPGSPETVVPRRFPIFILDRGPDDMVYGFPDFEQRGVKAAPHNHGPVVGPDDWGPPASDAELRSVSDALAALVPGAAGPIVDRDVCLYTNTAPADIRRDAGEEFIIDRWPESRLIVCSACSGHGAKFAPAIGQRLARLATDPSYQAEPFFQLSRYSEFA